MIKKIMNATLNFNKIIKNLWEYSIIKNNDNKPKKIKMQ